MRKELTISTHALTKFQRRSGRRSMIETLYYLKFVLHDYRCRWYSDPYEVQDLGFNITQHTKGDRYAVWHDKVVDEYFCAVVSADNTVVTVLPHTIYDVPRRQLKYPPKMKQRKRRR